MLVPGKSESVWFEVADQSGGWEVRPPGPLACTGEGRSIAPIIVIAG